MQWFGVARKEKQFQAQAVDSEKPQREKETEMTYRCIAALLITGLLVTGSAFGREKKVNRSELPPAADIPSTLTPDQMRELIQKTADNDLENDKKQRDYTYVERHEERRLDGKGHVKSTEAKTFDVMEIYGEQVQKLIAKNDKPLSEKDARKEDEKVQKLIEKRKNESAEDRKKRLQKEEKGREESRKFVREVADAYNFKFDGIESLDRRENYVIEGDPKPGYEPHLKEAGILPKFRFRAWIDKDEAQWKKLDIQCIETVSWGLFIARLHKGSRIVIEQTRVNDEVWLPQHVNVNVDVRLALLKNIDIAVEQSFRDYKKFRTGTKVISIREVQESH
jgi:hypothetical protein